MYIFRLYVPVKSGENMLFLEVLKSIVMGIVEGITEWLPISSTGHMILFDAMLKMRQPEAFKSLFLVVIQLGAILAVVLLFFHKLNPFSRRKSVEQKRRTWNLWGKILVASVPAGVAGILFDDQIDAMLTGNARVVIVAAALILYGVLFIVLENRERQIKVARVRDLSYKTALLMGVFQMLALVPGTSRSGSTILGGIILGVARPAAAEFSFYMSIPAMFGGSAIKLVKYFADGFSISGGQFLILLTGTAVSFVVSLFAIKFLLSYVRRHDFKVFGYYRIVLGVIVLIYSIVSAAVK